MKYPDAKVLMTLSFYTAETNLKHSSVCWLIVKGIAELENVEPRKQQFVIQCLGEYLNNDAHIKFDDAVSVLRDVAIDGLYEHLDEHLDERNSIYSILIKYKQRSEWFRKNRLRDYAQSGLENKKGEVALAIDVQEYILDQGVEFFVEPASASGEVDLVLKSSEGRYIVVDAKYVKNESSRSSVLNKLASGFHQVARYCNDFDVGEGFLVNFVANTTRIRLGLDTLDSFPYLNVGNKIIYYIEVNIADEPSASKSGKATEIELSKEELISTLEGES
ncbi:hypothetical protein RS130_18825 [Paraglaciecola aquimarina]|uniref:PD-(D/E)XK endonuclease-like domain-containing protein n=1 Tax=Paraglaciecola aquimarina TaxID=1235557 RepID=A0ABU3T064_9ALTE|nr:hypothetical protein [Paraglaciecola aquimarina]MDU0355660.1 hypothetical protein [Paraglaciecola aquimarina]